MDDEVKLDNKQTRVAEEDYEKTNRQLCDPSEFLERYTTPERAALLTSAYNTLLSLGYDTLTDEVLTLVRESVNMGPDMVLSGFNGLIAYVQTDAMRKHGITLRVNTPIETQDALLRGLVTIADYEDVEQLLTSFEMAIMSDPTDVFVDMLEEVLDDDLADEIALCITNLSTAFLPAMKKYLTDILEEREDNDMQSAISIDDVTLAKLRKQADVADDTLDIQMPTLLAGTMPPKLDYQYYINELAYRHRNETDMRTIASDMLMACTICAENPDDPMKFISEYLIDFTDDVNKQVEIMNRVRYILGELAIEPK